MMKMKFKQANNSTIINKAKNHLSLQIIENKIDEVLTWDQQKEVDGPTSIMGFYPLLRGRRGCEFESRSGRGVQHYVIKFVSDL